MKMETFDLLVIIYGFVYRKYNKIHDYIYLCIYVNTRKRRIV